jgi:hypothetical protein
VQTIYKYRLEITDAQRVKMPEDAEILTAQFQGEDLCLWAVVDTDRPIRERVIEIFGTGNPMWVDMGVHRKFIATAQRPNMPPVWHVFESML